MSTLEKFGILVILILVVIIGVVAVWGVGGDPSNPFENGDGSAVATADGTPVDPAAQAPEWPTPGGAAPVAAGGTATGPVAPPAVGTAPTPATAPVLTAPVAAGASTYTVEKGDTMERIARKTLGDGSKWPQIAAANPDKSPKRLKIGDKLKIPGGTQVAEASGPANGGTAAPPRPNSLVSPNPDDGPSPAGPATPSLREVEVRSGDTLYEIARRELGDPNLYYKIQAANPGLDPKRLKPGMKIKLPAIE